MVKLHGGAYAIDITPQKPMALFGYPFVERISTGTHDPLLASAVVLANEDMTIAMCSLDLLFVTKKQTASIRNKVNEATGIKPENIMVACTHTHSGPVTVYPLHAIHDPTVPQPDEEYIEEMIDKTSQAIIKAYEQRHPVELGFTVVDATGVGGNRRCPDGVADPEVPVWVMRDADKKTTESIMLVHCMHPTVLHEDSTLFSGDYPGASRLELSKHYGQDLVVAHFTGPEGNQSPRHHVSENTFAEAHRLGSMFAARVIEGIEDLNGNYYSGNLVLNITQTGVMLERKSFPSMEEALSKKEKAKNKLERLQADNIDPKATRTAECDWFGACETVALSELSANGEMDKALSRVLPAEIQVIRIGNVCMVTFQGELFVEYSLQIKESSCMPSFAVCVANGGLSGYIVTQEAFDEGGYEASNSIFAPKQGQIMMDAALGMINEISGK